MQKFINDIFPYYRQLRHQLHAHPEIRYEEFQTAELIATELQKLSLSPQMNIGKTGIVAVLDSGIPGKTIALRADMDALPLIEKTALPYSSQIKGNMHACGHDGHTATLLATAHVLSKYSKLPCGKVKFIFQPAEEGGAGAKAMIDDGVLENPTVDAIFAFHNHPGSPLGHVSANAGSALYGHSLFQMHIQGKGGHAAQPENVINPIIVASEVVLALQNLVQRFSSDKNPTIIGITQMTSTAADNIIPDKASIFGTLRAASPEKIQHTIALIHNMAESISQKYQATIHIQTENRYPPTINTSYETEFLLNQARRCLGDEHVSIKPRASRASEDFSYYLQKIPGCYFFIGNGEESAFCHQANYDFNDEIIKTGALVLSQVAIAFLAQ